MEALDRALARNANRLDPNKVFKPIEIRIIDDIRRAVAELDPNRNKQHSIVPVSTVMDVAEDKTQKAYRVSANTQSKSKRDIIVEAFDMIRKRISASAKMAVAREPTEINGRQMQPAAIASNVDGTNWIDKLLSQWLGAYRDGTMICWKLPDGCTYKYDIYLHKLTKVSNGN